MASPILHGGLVVFRNGHVVFSDNPSVCLCCNFPVPPDPVICCDGKEIRQLTLTLGGLPGYYNCMPCWQSNCIAHYGMQEKLYEAFLSNLNGSYTLTVDGLEGFTIERFGIQLGTQGDVDDPGILIERTVQTYATDVIVTEEIFVWQIRAWWDCVPEWITGDAVAFCDYYIQRRISYSGDGLEHPEANPPFFASVGYLHCDFWSIVPTGCDNQSYFPFPCLAFNVRNTDFDAVCNGDPMTGEQECEPEDVMCSPLLDPPLSYTATASITIEVPA